MLKYSGIINDNEKFYSKLIFQKQGKKYMNAIKMEMCESKAN